MDFSTKFSSFFRPFTDEAWTALFIVLAITFVVIFTPNFFFSSYKSTTAYMVASTSGWFLFVFINAYYGGALTMFFSNEIKISFENIRDVMRAYPDWTLHIMHGK